MAKVSITLIFHIIATRQCKSERRKAEERNNTGMDGCLLSFFPSGFAGGGTMVLRCLAMFLFVKRTPSLIGHLRRSQIGLGNLRADPKN